MSLSANFLTALTDTEFRGNVVISVDGTFFSQYQPDSGLVIDADKLGLVDQATINGVSLDIRRANTPIATVGFNLVDSEEVVTVFMGNDASQLQEKEVKLYFGFMGGSFDFADYALLAVTRINKIDKVTNGYKFTSKESTDLIQKNLLNVANVLDGPITISATTLDLVDAAIFPVSGRLKIDNEFFQYTGKTGNQLTGLSRGDLTSTAIEHDDGDDVYLVTKKEAESMDILLDILLTDLAIDPALVDSTSFTSLRDNEFNGEDDLTLYIYDISNALKWIETRLLDATNTRIFSVNGVITIGLLDQAPVTGTLPEITEEHMVSDPSWSVASDKIVNKIIVKWFFNEGNQKFARTSSFTDTDSIATYQERKALTLNLYGVTTSSIVSNRACRLLARFSTPRAAIKAKTHLNRLAINVADNVQLTTRYLPQQGGGLGFNGVLEVMSRNVSGLHRGATIAWGLEFTSYTGIRLGLISPSPKLNLTVTSQNTFEVPDGTCYKVGYALELFDNINNLYFTDAVNTVASISGNFLTMTTDWVTVLGAGVSLYFDDYDASNGDQRAQYAYTAPDTGIFVNDGSKAYQIIF